MGRLTVIASEQTSTLLSFSSESSVDYIESDLEDSTSPPESQPCAPSSTSIGRSLNLPSIVPSHQTITSRDEPRQDSPLPVVYFNTPLCSQPSTHSASSCHSKAHGYVPFARRMGKYGLPAYRILPSKTIVKERSYASSETNVGADAAECIRVGKTERVEIETGPAFFSCYRRRILEEIPIPELKNE